MVTSTLTGEAVWNKLKEDPEFETQPPILAEAMKPLVEYLPTLLSDLLDKPVTIENLMEAKMRFIRYFVDNLDKVASAIPENYFTMMGMESAKEFVDTFQGLLNEMVNQLVEIIESVPDFLKQFDLTEEKVITEAFKHKEEFVNRYLQGKLTIGDLLAEQPMIIVKNTE